MWSRGFGVLGVLFLVLAWRLDQAVRTAYTSGWTAGLNKERLPDTAWDVTHTAAGLIAIVLFTAALTSYLARTVQDAEGAQQLYWVCGITAGAAIGLEAIASVFRGLADDGTHATALKYALALDIGALALLAIFVLAVATFAESSHGGLGPELRQFVQRHRVNLVGVVFFALVLVVIGDTSGQAIDSIRTWFVGDAGHDARLAFGLGSATLLAIVVYESGTRMSQIDEDSAAERRRRRAAGVPRGSQLWWWIGASGATVLAWVLLRLLFPLGFGILVLAGLFLVLALLELPAIAAPGQSSPVPPGSARERAELAPEYLAIAPLIAISIVALASFVEATLSDAPGFHATELWLLVAVLGPAAVAVVMTRSRPGDVPDPPPGGPWMWGITAGSVLGIGVLVLLVSAAPFTAVVAFLLLAGALVYTWTVFHAPPAWRETFEKYRVALPFAVCAGAVVAVAIEIDNARTSDVLGVFGLASIALAFGLAILSYVVGWSLQHRPPRFIWSIGVEQLPILTLLFLWWVGAGLIYVPRSLHDARVVAYRPVSAAPPATLQQAFQTWLTAQGDRWTNSTSSEAPLPLVLVASHGGGIRAAYWTGLALDCVVAGESEAVEQQGTYAQTCTDKRRTPDAQAAAARSIFMASGVSGGAVGLYAYARELLAPNAAPLPPGWIVAHLGSDHASATIGWALFHDLPNHLLDLFPRTGATKCQRFEGWWNHQCLSADRASVLEQSFDDTWAGPVPTLRENWTQRFTPGTRARALDTPLLLFNSTVAGGATRAIDSAIALGDWPQHEQSLLSPTDDLDTRPLAGTLQVLSALCSRNDLPLSTAALLAGRFPYVSPSGRINGNCAPYQSATNECPGCRMSLVDGGYTDNSGLFTLEVLLPSIRTLIQRTNAAHPDRRPIALVLVELDNHYRANIGEVPQGGSATSETLVPARTIFGGHATIETFARSDAYRLTPGGCTITISPALHPGLEAPLGWELSKSAREDLQNGLVRRRDSITPDSPDQPLALITRLQAWLGGGDSSGLSRCVPAP
jgi:hypothetical protein